jgi:hypothetical protein
VEHGAHFLILYYPLVGVELNYNCSEVLERRRVRNGFVASLGAVSTTVAGESCSPLKGSTWLCAWSSSLRHLGITATTSARAPHHTLIMRRERGSWCEGWATIGEETRQSSAMADSGWMRIPTVHTVRFNPGETLWTRYQVGIRRSWSRVTFF